MKKEHEHTYVHRKQEVLILTRVNRAQRDILDETRNGALHGGIGQTSSCQQIVTIIEMLRMRLYHLHYME